MSRVRWINKWTQKNLRILKEKYPDLGTRVIKDLEPPIAKKDIRYAVRKLGIKTKRRRWDRKEDQAACIGYLKNIKPIKIINHLYKRGFPKRTLNSMNAKIANYRYLDTGEGYYYGYSQQALEVYIQVSGNTAPHLKPKKKGGWY